MKKVVASAIFLAAAIGAFAKDAEFFFSNKIGSNVIDSWHWSSKSDDYIEYGKTKFAGVYDEIVAKYEGDVLKVGVDKAKFVLTPWHWKENNSDDTYYKVEWDDVNWYVEFNPWKMIGLGFSDELYTEGSHLFVWDDDLRGGNYSTDGFAVLIRPDVEGLTIGAGFDYPAWFSDNDTDGDTDPALAVGVDYNAEQFSIGGGVHHLTNSDSRVIGVHAALKMIEGLGLHVGFTHAKDLDVGLGNVTYAPAVYSFYRKISDGSYSYFSANNYYGLYGKNVLDASISYEFAPFTLAADLAVSLDSKSLVLHNDTYDLYSAVEFMFNLDSVSKGLGLDVKGFVLYDMGHDSSTADTLGTTWGVKPQIVYKVGNAQNDKEAAKHEFRAGVAFQNKFEDDYSGKDSGVSYWYLALPISWKYTY